MLSIFEEVLTSTDKGSEDQIPMAKGLEQWQDSRNVTGT